MPFMTPSLATVASFTAAMIATNATATIDLDVLAPISVVPPSAPFALQHTTTSLPLALGFQTQEDKPGDKAPIKEASGEIAPVNEAPDDSADLAKKLSNPIANLISVPFQFNYTEGYGPKDAGNITLNIQPVIPISITEDWNHILRTIVPVIYQGSVADGVSSDFGLGDTTQSFFFSPKDPIGGWIIGFGPAMLYPTATERDLGSGKWGAGPTIVLLRQDEGWTYGLLANQIWSFAGPETREDVNATFLQPFVTYTFPTATSIILNTESTYDWVGHEWSTPINLGVAQIFKFGRLPVQLYLGGTYYPATFGDGPEWGVRFQVTLLFPK